MLETAVIVRIVVACLGVLLLTIDFLTYCKQKIKENFAFLWGMFGVILVLISAITPLAQWSTLLSGWGYVAVLTLATVLVWLLFTMSMDVSQLALKNQELAMQVSLLNSENAKVLQVINRISEK